jgi:acetylornithine deacetylase/succinyl-diaminopimelate desuccinylase-like protein
MSNHAATTVIAVILHLEPRALRDFHNESQLWNVVGVLSRLVLVFMVLGSKPFSASAEPISPHQQLARDILAELIEINTVTATGDTAKAAEAMAARLRAAGFSGADVQVFTPVPHKGNLVARLRGTGARKPILLLAHLDVVEAKREDWSVDPFKFLEKDGYFYGRGSLDDKAMAAIFVANLIRYKREGYKPDRDVIVALETDEEIGDANAVGMLWLLKNHRDLIDAEFALNEGGSAALKDGRPYLNRIQTSEKVSVTYRLEVKNPGGHSSAPARDNAIYHLADALGRMAKFEFPVKLNETTQAYFERMSALETGQLGADMKAITLAKPDPEAIARLSAKPVYNAQLRTTCVATMLEGGHAYNALPQVARATVNCRVLPGEPVEEVQKTLVRVLADDQISVTQTAPSTPSPPSPLKPEIMQAVGNLTAEFWPGIPVMPTMAASATDSAFLRNAGILSYGHSGLMVDIFENRAHGKDERIGVKSFYDGLEYLYQLVMAFSSKEEKHR